MTPIEFKKFIWDNPYKLGHMLGYKKLTESHNNAIKYCWLGGKDRALLAYRNYRKTTAILVVGIIWALLFFPDSLIAIIRKSESGAMSILSEIIKHYEGQKLKYIYKTYFNYDFKLKDYNQKKLNLPCKERITKEHNIEVFGKGGNITGAHFDYILIDDIVTLKDRYSKAERESTKEYVKELKNVKTANGKIIATGTPWHPQDAFSEMHLLPTPLKIPLGAIDDPEINNPEKIKELKTLGQSLFACNYELRHIADENSLFPDMRFKVWDDNITSSGWLDPAWGGVCTTGITFIQKQKEDLVIRGWVYHSHITDCKDKLKEKMMMCNCVDPMFESNGVDREREKEIKDISPLIRGVHANDNKNYRIIFNIKKNYDRLYFADDCQLEYLEQMRNYIEGEVPNEAPDSLASLLRERFMTDTGEIQISEPREIKDFKS